MSNFDRCSNCGKYDFLSHHTCPPVWQARRPEMDEDWCTVRAGSAGDAAEEHALRVSTWSEYGEVVARQVIEVRRDEESEVLAFEVHGELVPSFNACRVTLV